MPKGSNGSLLLLAVELAVGAVPIAVPRLILLIQ